MGYSARSLHARELGTRSFVRDVTRGRLLLRDDDVRALADALGHAPETFLAPLTDDEFNIWSFNSTSTRYRLPVWQSAKAHWTRAGYSALQAAKVLGITDGRLHDAFQPVSTRRLLFPNAHALSTALSLPEGPRTFLLDLPHRWREAGEGGLSHEPRSSRFSARDD